LTEFQKRHMLTPPLKEVPVLASRMRLAVGVLWTFLNSMATRRASLRLWETSAGDLRRFEFAILLAMWWMAASAVLGVVIIYDIRRTLRYRMNGARLVAALSSGEGDNV
jgi:hypothetical protein